MRLQCFAVILLRLPDPLPLACHPSSRSEEVEGITAHAHRTPDAFILQYRLRGRLDRLAIPGPREPARRDELWRHTCFEAFVRSAGVAGYVELNFAPSGEWAAYRFDAYRAGMRDLELAQAPKLDVRQTHDALDLSARIDGLPEPWGSADTLWLALTAVVEANDGAISYWSLTHPAEKADFHHPDGFAAMLT